MAAGLGVVLILVGVALRSLARRVPVTQASPDPVANEYG